MILTIGQAARLPRGVSNSFPNFHAIHHGHGATSYQNVQIESYEPVPVPTLVHQRDYFHHTKQEEVLLLEKPQYLLHGDHEAAINPVFNNHGQYNQYQQSVILQPSDQNVFLEDDRKLYYILETVPEDYNEIEQNN
ncbi:hypothetical protein TKK_0008090 [Trichogramma kaykai]|uniref:Uncharacterized protein n=1 Tax=Trichogramma kaykai TaxID=54128 RepID=A0ABD2X6U0_9HYME